MTFKEIFESDCGVPANNAGAGAIDGIGIGDKGEPPVKKRPSLFKRYRGDYTDVRRT